MYLQAVDSNCILHKFQVHFNHTLDKKGRRQCICEIWLLSEKYVNDLQYEYPDTHCDVRDCSSDKHPNWKSKVLLIKATATCSVGDNYSKAYARALSLKRALRGIISLGCSSDIIYYNNFFAQKDIEFTHDTFHQFLGALKTQCTQGIQHSMKLQYTPDYNPKEEYSHR